MAMLFYAILFLAASGVVYFLFTVIMVLLRPSVPTKPLYVITSGASNEELEDTLEYLRWLSKHSSLDIRLLACCVDDEEEDYGFQPYIVQ